MAHTYHQLRYHLVFATHHRRPLIDKHLQEALYRYIRGAISGEGGHLIEIGGMPDHVHILAGLKPSIAISRFLKQIKGGSSFWVNQERPQTETFGWQKGYGAFSVSPSRVDAVRRYIQDQEKHHHTRFTLFSYP